LLLLDCRAKSIYHPSLVLVVHFYFGLEDPSMNMFAPRFLLSEAGPTTANPRT
jgi:hypothetical protein